VAILDDDQLMRYQELARGCGLTSLVEVHDEEELNRALKAGSEVIGVNNRNLKTFKVDLGTTESLASRLFSQRTGPGTLLVAESGIHSRADVNRVKASGAKAILVGESLMRGGDIRRKAEELLGE
jgi:indole-3-glycerol phosphate synthase